MTTRASGSQSPRSSEPWEQRLGQILAMRDNHSANQVSWRKTRAELRRGNSAHTEHYAYPYVLPWAGENASQRTQTVLLRLFALVAEFEDIPQLGSDDTHHVGFGQWCYRVSAALARSRGENFVNDPGDPDAVAQRLRFLHTLDAEKAILNASRIMTIAQGLGTYAPAIDYYDLFRTFLRWGNGLSPQSQAVRRRLLRDYYAAYAPTTEDPGSAERTNPAAS